MAPKTKRQRHSSTIDFSSKKCDDEEYKYKIKEEVPFINSSSDVINDLIESFTENNVDRRNLGVLIFTILRDEFKIPHRQCEILFKELNLCSSKIASYWYKKYRQEDYSGTI